MSPTATSVFLLLACLACTRADVKDLNSTTIKLLKDHSKDATDTGTYDHRFLFNIDDYDSTKGPVLFYAGGEGDIKEISEKQKLFRTLAQNLSAAVVFAEHRYYGESLPAGKGVALSVDNLKFLTVENVLADYVDIINHFRKNIGKNENAPVIAYGSKYAGLLAAWLKVRNDKLITGAIASSAPVLDFDTNTDNGRPAVSVGEYDQRVTEIYVDAGCNDTAIEQAFIQLSGVQSADLDSFFRLKPKVDPRKKDVAIKKVRYLVKRALYEMAENNYPYKTNNGANGREMVENPVKEACKSLATASSSIEGTEDLKNLATAIGVYYGTTGEIIIDSRVGGYIPGTAEPIVTEAYEHCTDMGLFRCTLGDPNDFFPKTCSGDSEFKSKIGGQCRDWLTDITFNQDINTDWIKENIGFDYAKKSHIVFITGSLDPNAGGVYPSKDANADAKNGIYTYNAEQGTTGHDLLEPNTCDPNTVKNVRFQIVKIVKCWSGLLSGKDCDNLKSDLPKFDSNTPAKCEADAYPWGQTEAPPSGTPRPGGPGGKGDKDKGASTATLSILTIVGSFAIAAMIR